MSLSDVVFTFRVPHTVTVTRRDAETYSQGRLVRDSTPTVLILNTSEANAVSVVPGGHESEQESPGQSSENKRVMYSRVALRARSDEGPGDVVTLPDGSYEVVAVKDWSGLAGDDSQNCWECTLAEQSTP